MEPQEPHEPQRKSVRPIDVISSIAVLLVIGSLLLPAVSHQHHQLRRARCESNLRNLGKALLSYQEIHLSFPPGVVSGAISWKPMPWAGSVTTDRRREVVDYVAKSDQCDNAIVAQTTGLTLLLPLVGEKSVHDAYNFSLACCAIQNATAVSSRISAFVCPDNSLSDLLSASWGYYRAPVDFGPIGPAPTDYAFCIGATGLITNNHLPYYISPGPPVYGWPGVSFRASGAFNINLGASTKRARAITDGASLTFAMGEASGGLPVGLHADVRPALGDEPISAPVKTAVMVTPWSQAFIGAKPRLVNGLLVNAGGFGSVFATTAWNAWHDMNGELSPPDQCFPIPPNEGGTKMARPSWYLEATPDGAVRTFALDGSGIPGSIGSLQGFRSSHPTVPMLFADGSVKQIKPTIDLKIWVGLSTIQGRELIPDKF